MNVPTRILITGATGFFGWNATRWFTERGFEVHGIARQKRAVPDLHLTIANICSLEELSEAFAFHRPDLVVHAAAISSPGVCELHPVRAHEVNVLATSNVFSVCVATQTPFVLLSTDLVFDGTQGNYTEQDAAFPKVLYGHTKLGAERVLIDQQLWDQWAVLRCSLMWGDGPSWSPGFPGFAFTEEAIGEGATLFTDQFRSPVHVDDVCKAIYKLYLHQHYGALLHCGGPERLQRHEFALRFARSRNLSADHILARSMYDVDGYTTLVQDVSLDSSALKNAIDWEPRRV